MIAIANAREGEATEFGIRLGLKVKELWENENR